MGECILVSMCVDICCREVYASRYAYVFIVCIWACTCVYIDVYTCVGSYMGVDVSVNKCMCIDMYKGI